MKKRTNYPRIARLAMAGLLLAIFAIPLSAAAQSLSDPSATTTQAAAKEYRGLVTDAEANPLPSLAVVLKGTRVGVVTDAAGKFTFPQALSVGDVLEFSYLGMETQELTIGADTPTFLQVTMEEIPIEIFGATASTEPYTTKGGLAAWWAALTDRQ